MSSNQSATRRRRRQKLTCRCHRPAPTCRPVQRRIVAQSYLRSLRSRAFLPLGRRLLAGFFFSPPATIRNRAPPCDNPFPLFPERANYSTSRHRFIQASLAPRSQQLFIRRSWLPPRWSPVSDSTRCTSCVSHGTAGVARRRRRRRLLRRRPTGCAQFLFCHTARARALPTRLRASTTASASAGTIGALRRIRPFRAAIAFARFSSSPPPLPSRSRVRDGAARADGRPAERRAAAGGGGGGADGSPVVDGRRRRLRHRQLQRVGRADPAAAERAGPRRVFEPAAGDVPVQVHRGQRVALRGGAADGARRDGQHQQLPDRHRPEHLSQRKPGVGLFRAPRNSPHFAAHFGAAV